MARVIRGRERIGCVLAMMAATFVGCSTPSGGPTAVTGAANATCHGEAFGKSLASPPGGEPDMNRHVVVSEVDMAARQDQELTRIGDFNVVAGRIHVELRRPRLAAGNDPAASASRNSDVQGDYPLSGAEAEMLVCAANNIWGEPNSTIVQGGKRLSQLVLWREDRKKEVSGEGDFDGASKTYSELFWRIADRHEVAESSIDRK